MTIKKNSNTVSIITITQYRRIECIKILYEMIKRQTYDKIKEWVIVEGSQSKDDGALNGSAMHEFINKIKSEINFTINYIEFSGKKNLGGLRNLGNAACKGDIIVCLDDDDYYPRERISHAVERLSNSPCLIGGVSDVYLYDIFVNRLYKFKGFMEFHSTNNCMAYKRDYLISNKHDPEIMVGEERSFTSEFTKPLVKFDSRKTIIAIGHSFNTFNKRELCVCGSLKTLNTLEEIQEPITNYIESDIYEMMKKVYSVDNCIAKHDIVYLLGCYSKNFDPKGNDLESSELSIVKFAEYCAKEKKKTVAVYGDFDLEKDKIINNVEYIHWKKFPYHHKFKTLILWRAYGIMNGLVFDTKADNMIWDSHDNPVGNDKVIELWKKHNERIDKVIVKSNFHYHETQKYLGSITNFEIIQSGVRIKEFQNNSDKVKRNPYRFCHTAYYDRGIEFIVNGIFSVIKKIEPRAELHVYGGMEMIQDEGFINKMNMIFSENGVTNHSKQSYKVIAREKNLSTFHIYISNIVNEIDPVDIKESISAGCIPLLANFGVFNEIEGIKYDMNHENQKVMQRIALEILKVMRDTDNVNKIREQLKSAGNIYSWDTFCSKMWSAIN
jgi:glycosyltransferase involved in cell wall biosynthesis